MPFTDLNDFTGLERNLQKQYKASNMSVGYVANSKVDNEVSQLKAIYKLLIREWKK
jgi:hypothetical protein